MKYKYHNNAQGIALIILLVLIAAITIIGLSFVVRGDRELVCGQNMEMRTDMDYLAESGLEQAKGLIMYPQDLSTEYFAGASQQQLAGGDDYYDVNVAKLSELNWQITSLAYRQTGGNRVAQNSLTANLRLDPAIGFWSWTDIVLNPATVITGDVYCNGVLTNSGSINGDCFADSLVGHSATGAVKAKTALQLGKPAINCSKLTGNFSTQSIGTYLNNITLNSGAKYIYYCNGDLGLGSNVSINGCLAVDGNLTIGGPNNIINARKNVPAIYVSGHLIMKENSSLDCNGLVYVDGRIEEPICNMTLRVTGALFTDEGMRYIVPDYSGSGSNGIINGHCAWAVGKFNGAINFDGSDDFIDVGNPSQLNITDKMTVTAWINVTAFDKPYQAIITKGNTSWRLERSASTNNVEFVVNTTDGSYVYAVGSGVNVNDGQWHHIAGVYDDSLGAINLYIDGVLAGTGESGGNIVTNSQPLYIGENAEQRGRYFNGLIDDVRIYKMLSPLAQILNIMAGGSPASGNLMGQWTMDSGNCSTMVTASPTKAAIYDFPGGSKSRWSPAAGAFFKSITRNP